MSTKTPAPLASAPAEPGSKSNDDTAVWSLKHIQVLWSWAARPKPAQPKYPPIASIPRTSADRLREPDVAPTPFPAEPIRASDVCQDAPAKPKTVLYLAYGSNMAAETFLGMRGIRPLSQVNVSAPSLELTFDLPGIPYREPCFANTAMRKVPGKKPPFDPPELPPGIPGRPPRQDGPGAEPSDSSSATAAAAAGSIGRRDEKGDPVWTQGLYGVVYEVTPEDYARIMATEGGGASYHDILVPCFPLPPSVSVPEHPPAWPPAPFLAHTLYAPRLPDSDSSSSSTAAAAGTNPAGNISLPGFLRRLFLPARRPEGAQAQPSLRYLNLLRTGAREHELPAAYQAYLGRLRPYRATTRGQRLGQVLFLGFWLPPLVAVMAGSRLLADERGRAPGWLVAASTCVFNLIWKSYDAVGKGIFGDGERCVEEEGEEGEEGGNDEKAGVAVGSVKNRRRSFASGLRGVGEVADEEKVALLEEHRGG
ncbi:hypothetical protein VTJ83DRAFT_798 [Remersonia thermophila]|uniref:gamma-glutamylcyclotransferase n=1 Tax=Remersonia thermophila TaxID=72144 RepID=A0ABR4DNR9_9PEZI